MKNAVIIVITIEIRNIIDTVALTGLSIFFHCLFGPTKKNEEDRETILPKVYQMANHVAPPVKREKNDPKEIIVIISPMINVTINPIILVFKSKSGQQLALPEAESKRSFIIVYIIFRDKQLK
jgi:hypothetical protein